jgi:hypothetical protein
MAVWFASAAAASTLARRAPLSGIESALLTSAVQAGFVCGTLASTLTGRPDRFDPRQLHHFDETRSRFCGVQSYQSRSL